MPKEKIPVYLVLGSNLGDRLLAFQQAVRSLSQYTSIKTASSVYETVSYGFDSANSFYNVALQIETTLPCKELLNKIFVTERQIGRIRKGEHWSDRAIDIDIALYGDDIYQDTECRVPHYDLMNRDFFLIPLLEINPSLQNPINLVSLQQQLANIAQEKRTFPVIRYASNAVLT